jgi:hypothetical protein
MSRRTTPSRRQSTSGSLPDSAASGGFFADAFGSAFGLGSLRIRAPPESQRPRRCRLGKISRNIDAPPARQDDVARDHAQIPFLAAVSLDHILGADRKPPRQTAAQTIYRQTHEPLLRTIQGYDFEPPSLLRLYKIAHTEPSVDKWIRVILRRGGIPSQPIARPQDSENYPLARRSSMSLATSSHTAANSRNSCFAVMSQFDP